MSMILRRYAREYNDVYNFVQAFLSVNNRSHWTKTRELAKVFYRAKATSIKGTSKY